MRKQDSLFDINGKAKTEENVYVIADDSNSARLGPSHKHTPSNTTESIYEMDPLARQSYVRIILNMISKEAKRQYGKNNVKLKENRLTIKGVEYTDQNLYSLPNCLRPENVAIKETEQVVFFYGPATYLSNFSYTPFKIGSLTFISSEQYIQHQKAMYFRDTRSAKAIMTLHDPIEIKRKGDSIIGLDQQKWVRVCQEQITPGIIAKFQQCQPACDALLATGTKDLAYANATDHLYGIGLSIRDPCILDKKKWGMNVMGNILKNVRKKCM